MFVDSHAHLDGKQFDSDRDQVIARAREAGVRAMVAIGNGDGPPTLDAGVRLAEQYGFMYATVGIHPHEARLASEDAYSEMERLARHPKVIAWGEIGLDYFYDHSPRDIQQQVFTRQMELAAAAKLPIVIHCRPSDNSDDAWKDCLQLIEERWAPQGIGGILHCFTGTWPQAKRALDMGFMISFAGNVTFPKAQQIRDAALEVPLDRMLIETDSPYLAPVPHRGKRNEPAFVKDTAAKLGDLRNLSAEDLGEQTSRNFYKFFKLSEITESKVPAHSITTSVNLR
ncbi:MAG TPA: TatD family hydrolase [Candidatus Sulfotelmatobacter sp.]|jgi:TatD DNase family protein|nr:TatD family hydrolase [Candidatus Sulfotelmatobacter sp.]